MKPANLTLAASALAVVFCTPTQAQRPLLTLVSSPAPRLAAQPDPPPQNTNTAVKDDLFAGTEKFAKGASSVDEVNMDPESLSMVGGPDAHRAHGMVLSVVRTYTYDKPGMYNPADVEFYRQKLETGDWHCSVHTRDKNGESTDICNRHRDPDLIENAIITSSPKSLTFIHSIRKIKPQGSSIESGGTSGLNTLPGVPLSASMAVFGAEMQAQMLASTAELRAHMPELTAQMHQLQLHMPELRERLRNIHPQTFSPEQQRQLDSQRQQLRLLQ